MSKELYTEDEQVELFRLRYRLKKKGYTQRLLSTKYGVTRQYLNMLLNGKRTNYYILDDLKKLVDIVNK